MVKQGKETGMSQISADSSLNPLEDNLWEINVRVYGGLAAKSLSMVVEGSNLFPGDGKETAQRSLMDAVKAWAIDRVEQEALALAESIKS